MLSQHFAQLKIKLSEMSIFFGYFSEAYKQLTNLIIRS